MLEFCKIDAEIVENQHTVGRHHTDATSLRNFRQQCHGRTYRDEGPLPS